MGHEGQIRRGLELSPLKWKRREKGSEINFVFDEVYCPRFDLNGPLGYKYIEVPWLVSKETIDITKPEWCRSFDTYLGSLVASGEQSFLEIRDKLERNKRYVCVTPCFRDETVNDGLHHDYFLKVELIHVMPEAPITRCYMMMLEAFNFFKKYGKVSMVQTEEGIDLEINGIEIGSYGLRNKDKFTWVYGTGCAEPRLSQALRIEC